MIPYGRKKRNKVDRCNICGKVSDLTWDHVPPKHCYNGYPVSLNDAFSNMPTETSCQMRSQNGLKFRSICSECNNLRLGTNLDKELADFTSKISTVMTSSILLPEHIVIHDVQINKVARAICGHMLAAKNFFDEKCLIDMELREFFLNSDKLPPKNLKLLYWMYPYRTIFIYRDWMVKGHRGGRSYPDDTISTVSAFPLAYVLTCGNENCGLKDLSLYCTTNIEDRVDIVLDRSSCFYPDTKEFRHYAWPLNISDDINDAAMALGSMENTHIVADREVSLYLEHGKVQMKHQKQLNK